MQKPFPKVLTIAGSDSGGGAGIQADLKTFMATGVYGMSVITALTAQNTLGVQAVMPVPASFVAAQLDSVFSDLGADVVKLGMLFSVEIIETVAAKLREYEVKNLILDPVMVATSGDKLLQAEAVHALKSLLFPMATLITPNLPEAELLLQKKIRTMADMELQLTELTQWGNRAALLKGGHLEGEMLLDLLYIPDDFEVYEFASPKIDTPNTHGTGCTLAAAIAAYLAVGNPLSEAVKLARNYLHKAIEAGAGYQLGKGKGPVKH